MSILPQEEKEEVGRRADNAYTLTAEDKQTVEDMFDDATSYLWNTIVRSDIANIKAIQKQYDKYKALLIKVRKL